MTTQSPDLMRFVLYSTSQLVASEGAGFWSNDAGWVDFKFATQFTQTTLRSCTLVDGRALDARWMMWEQVPATDTGGVANQRLQITLPMFA